MNQVIEFFKNLFATNKWPARWYCGEWTDFHGWLYIISSFIIFASYFLIPFFLFKILKKRKKELPFQKLFWLFIAFILACGYTHFLDALIFWFPVYRFSALMLFFTAIISAFTVYALSKSMPQILELKTPEQMKRVVQKNTEEFVYSVAHNLKSPLNNALTLIDLLEHEEHNPGFDKAELFRTIKAALTKMNTSIIQMADIVKVNTEMYNDVQVILLQELLDEILDELNFSIYQNKVSFDLQIGFVNFSRRALKTALFNIIDNAIKYKSKERMLSLTITAFKNKTLSSIVIEDNGSGFESEINNNQIFKLQERYHTTIQGTGTGLYLAQRILQDKGANIHLMSTPNKGTKVTITLPE